MIDFVITGSGRSGTLWAAEALSAAGLPCSHERACSSWTDDYGDDLAWMETTQIGESSWQAAPFVGAMQEAGVRVVHLVRHPMEVASSLVANEMLLPHEGELKPWHKFIATHIGDHLFRLHPHDRALRFWIDWNKQIRDPDLRWTQPVDTFDIDALARLLGRVVDVHRAFAVTKDVNHWKPVPRLNRRDFVASIYDEAMDLWESYF